MPIIQTLSKTIILEDRPHAIYKVDEKTLYFKRLATITTIFPGIETLYREATQAERDAFMGESFMEANGQIVMDKISSSNLKRIHSAATKLNQLTQKKKDKIMEYIHKYNSNIPFDTATKKFTIANNTDLHRTIASNEKRVARSIMKMKK